MRVLSVSVAKASRQQFGEVAVRTSIVKEPATGPVHLRFDGLDGDGMATPVWGGHRRPALYAYPYEHYSFWLQELGRESFPFGKFGENITTEGLLEESVYAGDMYQIGTARVQAIGFRIPCRNLALTMDETAMIKRFRAARKPGIFFQVIEEGEIASEDAIELLDRVDSDFTIADMVALHTDESRDLDAVRSLLEKPFLPGTITKDFATFIK